MNKKYKAYKRNKNIEEYYNKNNLYYAKPYKFYNTKYKIYKVFDMYFDENVEFNFEEFIKELRKVEPELLYVYNKMIENEKKDINKDIRKGNYYPIDRRRGWETYKFDNIEADMAYISDRWGCLFRIRWILDALHFLKVKEGICANQ
jgi:hypothetical protein